MQVNFFSFLILFIMAILLSGCSSNNKLNEANKNLEISNEKVTVLEKELDEKVKKLENELSQTTKSLSESKDKNTKLESDLNDLKNGAQMTIVEIRKQFENKNYDKVLELSSTLHTKFLDVPEDKEAQLLVKKIQNIKVEEAKKVEEEKAKILAEQSKSALDKARSILRISSSYPSRPNSAGGVDLHIAWKNNSDKIIKYAVFAVKPYNAVNDQVSSDIGGDSLFRGKETGPFKKGQGNSGDTYWENAWYNSTIKTVQFDSIEIEYMDGTQITIKDDDLKYIQY
jgi:hypothetical protein